MFTLVLFVICPCYGTRSLPLCEDIQNGTKAVCSKVKDYNHQQVPSLPTNIRLEISPIGIQEIDEIKQTITFQATISQSWVDDRLTLTGFSNNETGFLRTNHLKNELWIPDLIFPNTVHMQKTEGFKRKHLQVLYFVAFNGAHWITFTDVIMVTLDCKMRFNNFPFDEQQCDWFIRAYDTTASEVVLEAPILWISNNGYGFDYTQVTVNQSHQLNNPGLAFDVWIKSMDSSINPLPYNTEFSFARINFHLRRKSAELNKLLISYFFPSGAFAILSLFSFFIKPEVVSKFIKLSKTCFEEYYFRYPVEWECW